MLHEPLHFQSQKIKATVRLDGESETLVRWMDKVASIIQFFSYCVPAKLATTVQSVCGELRHLLHKCYDQKKKKIQVVLCFKICGSKFRHSYDCDVETHNQLLVRKHPSVSIGEGLHHIIGSGMRNTLE